MTNKRLIQDIQREFSRKGVTKFEDLLSDLIYNVMNYDLMNEGVVGSTVYLSDEERKEMVNTFLNELRKYDNGCFYDAIKKAVNKFNTS